MVVLGKESRCLHLIRLSFPGRVDTESEEAGIVGRKGTAGRIACSQTWSGCRQS